MTAIVKTVPKSLPHFEPCTAHGFQLVKESPGDAKDLTKAAHSFTLWTRHWKNAVALRNAFLAVVKSRFQRRLEQRPNENKMLAKALIKVLSFQDPDVVPDETKTRRSKRGKKKVDIYMNKLNGLASNVDLGCEVDAPLVHWCDVDPDSPLVVSEKLVVGRPCCRDNGQAFERFFVPIGNCLSSWNSEAEDRWTVLDRVLKKMALAYLCDVFADALEALRTEWHLAGIELSDIYII